MLPLVSGTKWMCLTEPVLNEMAQLGLWLPAGAGIRKQRGGLVQTTTSVLAFNSLTKFRLILESVFV